MVIGISGMISSGKSTLVKKLYEHYKNSQLLEEFGEDDEVFNTFLKWLYEKKPNLTIGFQSYVVENHSSKLNEKFEELKKNRNYSYLFLDRFSIEHYIFAHVNLKTKGTNYLQAYDALFTHLITDRETPDLAIYLDMSYRTFIERLFHRGRKVEIDNYEKNKSYFENLFNVYKKLFIEQAKKYNLDYFIVSTDDLNEDEVFMKVVKIIDNYKFKKIPRYLK